MIQSNSQIRSVLLLKKMRKSEWSWSILERAKFYAEWNNYFCAVIKVIFWWVTQKEVYLSAHQVWT